MEEKKELLRIEHLTVSFAQYEKRSAKQGELPVIRDLNVTVREGEIVAVVGSSGSGKSLLAHAIMGILPANAAASGTSTFVSISPVSRPSSIFIMVTPLTSSPFMTAHWIGAAPR